VVGAIIAEFVLEYEREQGGSVIDAPAGTA
jgi:hypothetical protein